MNDLTPFTHREMPHNIEAEQALLGALLYDNAVLDKVSGIVDAAHFYDPLHGRIFEETRHLVQAGRLASPVTLKTTFEAAPPIVDGLSVPQYLGRLVAHAVSTFNARAYAQAVYDLYVRRNMIRACLETIEAAHNEPPGTPTAALLDTAQAQLDGLRTRERNERDSIPIYEAMRRSIDQTNAAYQSGTKLVGLATGLRDLDLKLGGLAPSDLIIVGARPGMGKTAFAATIARNISLQGVGSQMYSLEMSSEQVASRLLASDTGISADRQRRGDIEEHDMGELIGRCEAYKGVPLHVDPSGGLTIAQIAMRARRECRRRKVGLILVDYLQLLGGSEFKKHNRTQEITEITNGLKALAKELEVPIMVLSQLNRSVEGGANTTSAEKRPQLSNLRDSGSIEQDADIVMFLYREEYYLANETPTPEKIGEWNANMARAAGVAEVIIAKHRHGPTGKVELGFDAERTLFTDRG